MGEFGVSKAYIRKYLAANCSIDDTRYMRKRIGKILKDNVHNKLMKLDNTLYSLL